MTRQPNRHVIFNWLDVVLGIAVELAYPVALGLIALGLAWLAVKLR